MEQFILGREIGRLQADVDRLHQRMDEQEERSNWNRRLIIILILYGASLNNIVQADAISDILAKMIKIALKF